MSFPFVLSRVTVPCQPQHEAAQIARRMTLLDGVIRSTPDAVHHSFAGIWKSPFDMLNSRRKAVSAIAWKKLPVPQGSQSASVDPTFRGATSSSSNIRLLLSMVIAMPASIPSE